MTVYFPLVVHGAMLIEPTEIGIQAQPRPVHRELARAGRSRQSRRRRPLPRRARSAPRRRLDETKAAREPRLRWTPPDVRKEAAE